MKCALLSDIHSNIQAFDACLVDAKRQGAQQYALLGDLVGYGANAAAVIDRVMALADAGAIVLQGNHDAMAVNPPKPEPVVQGKQPNPITQSAIWTHAALNPTQLNFLAQLPLIHHLDHTFLVHASARNPESWPYVEDESSAQRCLDAAISQHPPTRYVFCGHVHHQRLFYRGKDGNMLRHQPTAGIPMPVPAHRYWVSTIGSVGQPRDGTAQAAYALFDTRTCVLEYRRVPFDYITAAQAILDAGLPAIFAERLHIGR